MSKRYPGGVIRQTPDTPTQASATGVWNMTDVTQAQQTNNWPVANVPNPMSRSLRFRASASAYMNRTPTVASNRQTWTWSGWVKPSLLTAAYNMTLFGADNGTDTSLIAFTGTINTPTYQMNIYNGNGAVIRTTQYFRDPSAWYHFVVVSDTTNATAANRTRLYVNGVQVTAFDSATYPSQNGTGSINAVTEHLLGRQNGTTRYFDGYMAEVNFVDGQALAPTAFGQYDQFSNWTSKQYTGTYGTNGFYLPFKNYSSTGTLGLDFSGNNNTWTTNNFSVTAGSTYDSMTDVPTQWTPYNVTGDVGGIIRGNYAVLNPLGGPSGGLQGTLTNGNLTWQSPTSDQKCVLATTAVNADTTGKWYWEVYPTSKTSTYWAIGAFPYNLNQYSATSASAQYRSDGAIYVNTSNVTTVSSYTAGDVIGLAFDASTNQLSWYKNNTLQTTQTVSNSAGYLMYPGLGSDSSGGYNIQSINFGQYAFSYAPPSGYKSLCTTNLPTPTIQQGNLVMDATLYSGNGTSQTITTASGFKPDLVWIKGRNYADNHTLWNTVVGAQKSLSSDTTTAETTRANALTAFTSSGFTLGTDTIVNYSAGTYVGWQWQAGQGTTSSNTSGSITSTVSVNASAGFSVVTYTGNNTLSTVGHGLGVSPKFIIVKTRSGNDNWVCYHASLGVQYYTLLNTTAASYNNLSDYWSATAPSSSVFGINAYGGVNTNGATYVAYCWAEIAGFSKFGSYTGNGSTDGPFVYTGFRPKFVMFKFSTNPGEWIMQDTSRQTYNNAPNNAYNLSADSSCEENNGAVVGGPTNANNIDFLSNGFKIRYNNGNMNTNTGTYIFMAFAEYPFKSALAR